MSDSRIFEALGFMFLLVGMWGLLDGALFKKLLEDFSRSIGLVFVGGMMAAFLGYVMIVFHGIGNWGISVIIPIFGWMALVKGVVLMVFPEWAMELCKTFSKKRWLRTVPILIGGMGLLLLWFANM